MILFWLIEVIFLLYSVFADDWLIDSIQKDIKITTVKSRIKEVSYDILGWILANILMLILNVIIVFAVSIFALFVFNFTQPTLESEYAFNINALQDNLVTSGRINGSMFGVRGYVDGELSYFYARTMPQGEIIAHLPAKKTYIQYDNNVHPCIEVHQSQLDIPEWAYKISFLEAMNSKTTDYYVIIAPEGTITNEGTYQIDMQ